MDELISLNFDEDTIKNMIEIYPDLLEIDNSEVRDKIDILNSFDCSIWQIKDIIGSNPYYLLRTNSEIIDLTNYLSKIGFKMINVLLDSNPFILSKDRFEIENYINLRLNNGDSIDNIVDDLDSRPFLFEEI